MDWKLDERVMVGSWINTGSSVVAEIMAQAGFDFLVIDAEHSAVDVPQVQTLLQAIRAGNPACYPMVRMPGNTYDQTKRYLDAGAMGVIAPLITTEDETKELVRSVKYPPNGDRGVGYGRSHDYGFAFDEYMERANRDTMVCVQIEDITAVRNIDDILAIDGVEGVFIGPYDLSASMGITAQFEHPEYVEAVNAVLASCHRNEVRAGIHVVQPDPDEAEQRCKEGFNMIGYSLDITMLGRSCREGIAALMSDF